jgi:cellobiose phosphorylase
MSGTELNNQIGNKYGHFSDDGRENLSLPIHVRRVPGLTICGMGITPDLISHTGGGFSFLDSPRDNRLNRECATTVYRGIALGVMCWLRISRLRVITGH